MGDFFNAILYPIKWAESWVMYAWHWIFSHLGISADSGWSWALSIVGLTVVVRMLLIPLFVKQIHSSRRMQLIQPEMQKIQKKYKGKKDPDSQKAMQAEMMDLYKRTGTNPFSSCMPILIQTPFFFALFQILNNFKAIAEGKHEAIGPFTQSLAAKVESSTIFGSKLSDHFLGQDVPLNTKVLTAVLIVLMSLSTFTTQHQLMRKNMPESALDNPFAKQQKVLLYLMPIFFGLSGINFPIGVLLYWVTTNAWTMCQQFYVIRNMPAPGSAAEKAQRERLARKGKQPKEITLAGLQDEAGEAERTSRQRQQPVGKKRAKAKGVAPDQRVPGSSGSGASVVDVDREVAAEETDGASEGSTVSLGKSSSGQGRRSGGKGQAHPESIAQSAARAASAGGARGPRPTNRPGGNQRPQPKKRKKKKR